MTIYKTRLPSHTLPAGVGSEKILHKIYPCEISPENWENAEKLNGQDLHPADIILLKHQGRDYEIRVLKTY
jgi:hypothetical protein